QLKPIAPHAGLSLAPPRRSIHVREARGRRRVPRGDRHASPGKQCRGSVPAPPQDSIMQYGEFGFLSFGLVLLAAAVLSVPIARRLRLSAIVAYLVAGIIIGPYGLAAFGTPESIIPVSELGVVMLLFLIGLELELGRLVAMRRAIFGLGAAQLALTALTIGALGYAAGLVDWRGA